MLKAVVQSLELDGSKKARNHWAPLHEEMTPDACHGSASARLLVNEKFFEVIWIEAKMIHVIN